MKRHMGMVCIGWSLAAAAVPALARPNCRVWNDPENDAVIRRTDSGQTAPLIPGTTLPDLISATISAWMPTNPATDPYTGQIVSAATADIFRLDVVFKGLVNPPGPIDSADNQPPSNDCKPNSPKAT